MRRHLCHLLALLAVADDRTADVILRHMARDTPPRRRSVLWGI